MRNIIILFVGLATLLVGCYYDKEEELYPDFCDTGSITYSSRIEPIIQGQCAIPGCHVIGGTGDGDFSTFTGLKAKVDNGAIAAVVIQNRTMPPSGPLTQCQIDQFQLWINAGALND